MCAASPRPDRDEVDVAVRVPAPRNVDVELHGRTRGLGAADGDDVAVGVFVASYDDPAARGRGDRGYAREGRRERDLIHTLLDARRIEEQPADHRSAVASDPPADDAEPLFDRRGLKLPG